MKSITLLQFLRITSWHTVVILKVFEKGTVIFDNPLFVSTFKNDCDSYSDDFFLDFKEYFSKEVLIFNAIGWKCVEVIVLV